MSTPTLTAAPAVQLRAITPPVKVQRAGRRAELITLRPNGKYGARRARTHEEREVVSLIQRVRSILADPGFWETATHLPGNTRTVLRASGRPADHPTWVMFLIAALATPAGSQRAAIALVADPGFWRYVRDVANHHRPVMFIPAGDKPPARHHFSHFLRKWESPAWREVRTQVIRAGRTYALEQAKRLGHFNPNDPLEYNRVRPEQWVTLDGTVYQSPSNRVDAGRCDPASGWHSKGGAPDGTAYGTKYSIVETLSDDYYGQLLLSFGHVTPRPGKTQGDEAAASERLLNQLKKAAPGLRGAVSDSAFRGPHIRRLTRRGILILNHPVAAKNPNRLEGGRYADGRVERTHKIRTATHKGAHGYECRHTIYLHGSNPCVEAFDENGDTTLVPLVPVGYDHRQTKSGHVFYLKVAVECRRGNFTELIRLDQAGTSDVAHAARADLARFYPVGTPQFDLLYGRRNTSESFHAKMKRTMPRIPAYGRLRQDLFMLGYQVANNAIALAFHAQRAGQPNALDDTR